MVFQLWSIRSATRPRIPVRGIPDAAEGEGRVAEAAPRMSSLVIRPRGPVPVTVAGSTPSSEAIFRATGEILSRSPELRVSRDRSMEEGAASGVTVSGISVSAASKSSISLSSRASPGAERSASVAPIGRSSSAAARTLSSTLSRGASTSVVTLSVSTTSRGSPLVSGSPSCFSHSMILPFSIVCPRLGIPNLTAMARSQLSCDSVAVLPEPIDLIHELQRLDYPDSAEPAFPILG